MPSCRFSFSGIKVQALKLVERGAVVSDADRANMAAAVQSAVINHISKRLERCVDQLMLLSVGYAAHSAALPHSTARFSSARGTNGSSSSLL